MKRLASFCLFFVVILASAIGVATASSDSVGAVYVASNAATGNEIMVFNRSSQGQLTPAGAVATSGNGTGGGLGNQAGLAMSIGERFIYAVNAGSDSVSAFAIGEDGPELIGTYPSGGSIPISIALDRGLMYVLNAGGMTGGADNVFGFRVAQDGTLDPIGGSGRALSAASTGPAQVGFSADGRFVLVTEKATSMITVFTVGDDGTLDLGHSQPSIGMTPFGFAVDHRGRIFVSEAFGGAPNASAVSSYALDGAGNLVVLDPSVPTTETAACWFVVGNNGRFGYTTNTGSGTLSGYAIEPDGQLDLLDANGVTAMSGAGPIDVDFSRDGSHIYVLNGGSHSLSLFSVNLADGSLEVLGQIENLPASANGLVAR